MTTHELARALVASLDEAMRDRLFPLTDGPTIVEELTGRRLHDTALHRWAKRGIAGLRLQTITVGRRRYSTRRWLLNWCAAVDEAQRSVRGEAE
jgi:predicted RNase H-like nuclease